METFLIVDTIGNIMLLHSLLARFLTPRELAHCGVTNSFWKEAESSEAH